MGLKEVHRFYSIAYKSSAATQTNANWHRQRTFLEFELPQTCGCRSKKLTAFVKWTATDSRPANVCLKNSESNFLCIHLLPSQDTLVRIALHCYNIVCIEHFFSVIQEKKLIKVRISSISFLRFLSQTSAICSIFGIFNSLQFI